MSFPFLTSTMGSSSKSSLVSVPATVSSDELSGDGCRFDASRVMYRPMTSADVPRVKVMHHNILKAASTAAMLRQSLFHLHRRTFVAFIPSKPAPNHAHTKPLIVGFVTARISLHDADTPPEISITKIAVDTPYRRHGVGKNLIRAVSASLLMSATSRRPTGGDALVSVELRAHHPLVGYFRKMGWEREREARRGLARRGQGDVIRLSGRINAHQF